MIDNEHILLYDGVCNLCSRLVRFIKKRDKNAKLLFIPLQSSKGQSLLEKFGLPTDDFDSVVYIKRGKILSEIFGNTAYNKRTWRYLETLLYSNHHSRFYS